MSCVNHVVLLTRNGFLLTFCQVFAFDQRGFGQTGPKYGETSLGRQLQDLEFAIITERKRADDTWGVNRVPLFLYGHSMVSTCVLERHSPT